MTGRRIIAWLWARRWPMYLTGLLLLSIGANAILLLHATRADAPRPIQQYYQRSLVYEQTRAAQEASRVLGWQVDYQLPSMPGFLPAMKRPIDLRVTDRAGQPLAGLFGMLHATRPADARLADDCTLVALPDSAGAYRCLLRLPAAGLWELEAELRDGLATFRDARRVEVRLETAQP